MNDKLMDCFVPNSIYLINSNFLFVVDQKIGGGKHWPKDQ